MNTDSDSMKNISDEAFTEMFVANALKKDLIKGLMRDAFISAANQLNKRTD